MNNTKKIKCIATNIFRGNDGPNLQMYTSDSEHLTEHFTFNNIENHRTTTYRLDVLVSHYDVKLPSLGYSTIKFIY